MILFALTSVGLALVLFGFVLGVLYARSYPAAIVEPEPPPALPLRRRATTLRLVHPPYDWNAPRVEAPFMVVPSEEGP